MGGPAGWGPELCSAVRTVMPSRIPMLLWWGSDLVQIYNDAYRPLLGSKHPGAMGQPAAGCWAEVWDDLRPKVARVLEAGEATFDEDLLLFVDRHGYLEETYWTFSYSPVRSADGDVVGVFVATTDVTVARVETRRPPVQPEAVRRTDQALSVWGVPQRRQNRAVEETVRPHDPHGRSDARWAPSIRARVEASQTAARVALPPAADPAPLDR